jgi:SAM-dependent methyltransferase
MSGSLPTVPDLAVATEGYPPSVAAAAPRLAARGVRLVETSQSVAALPFADTSFDLIISRHPVDAWWAEIARVLRPGGRYFAQHVGPYSLRELSELFVGPASDPSRRAPEVERRAAEGAGLVVEDWRVERPRTQFLDIGAVVYFLRLVPWIVPGFTVAKYGEQLRNLHARIERAGPFEADASRMLVDVRKP